MHIVTGYTNLRSGVDRLISIIETKLREKSYIPDTLCLFSGCKTDRLKGLDWKSDGYLLLYKRLEQGNFQWIRSEFEVRELTPKQFQWLMEGLMITPKKAVRQVNPSEYIA